MLKTEYWASSTELCNLTEEGSLCHSDNAGIQNLYSGTVFQNAVPLASQFHLLLYLNPQIIEGCSDILAAASKIGNFCLKQTLKKKRTPTMDVKASMQAQPELPSLAAIQRRPLKNSQR